jgi:hypothetical protein
MQNDERNILITNKAKAKTYDLVIYIYSIILLLCTFMDTNMWVILSLCLANLFIIGYNVYCVNKYSKEM